MRQILTKISVAAALVFGCQFAAQANLTNLGSISGTNTFANTTEPGSFADLITFQIFGTQRAGLSSMSILFPTTYGALVQTMQLYEGAFGTTASLPLTPISEPFITTVAESNGTLITTLASSAIIAGGSYTLVVTGTSLGAAAYTGIVALQNLTNTVPPVPEPETYAMLLAGLGMLGFIARRRQKNT